MPSHTPASRIRARLRHYIAYVVVFLVVYGGVVVGLGRFPRWLLFGVLGVSILKDLLDEIRMARGGSPLGFAGFEHAPSNLVLLGLLLTGVVDPVGGVLGVDAGTLAVVLAGFDLAFDLSQDLRADPIL